MFTITQVGRYADPWPRALGTLATVALIPVGTGFGAAQELLAIAVLVASLLVVERWTAARGRTPVGDPAG